MTPRELIDAQAAPGNGGDQSPAGKPPQGETQGSLQKFAEEAGDPLFTGTGAMLDYRG